MNYCRIGSVLYYLLRTEGIACHVIGMVEGAQSMDAVTKLIIQRLSADSLEAIGNHTNITLVDIVKLHGDLDQSLRNERELFLFKALIDQIPDLLFVKDRLGKFVIANEAVTRAYGLQAGDLIGKSDYDLHPLAVADEFSRREQEIMTLGRPHFNMQESFPDSSGVTKWYSTTKVPLQDQVEGVTVGLIGIARDVTDRRQMEEQLVHMAHYDALTQLPNRILFVERLRAALSERRANNSKVALLYIDLDGFKMVNDTIGHHFGDVLLQRVSERLRDAVKKGDIVARLGGDEFAAIQILGLNEGSETSIILAEQITSTLGLPHEIEGHHVTAGATIGIAIAPDDDDDPAALLRDADIALYQAKAEKGGSIRFFEPEMNARMQQRVRLEADLRRALDAKSFELYYQPLVDLASNEVCGFEALIRWNHPERGLVNPIEFIGVAEEIGLIIPIGQWALREACKQAALWPSPIKVAVNLSPVQFKSDRLFQDVVLALSSSGLSPRRLELEITESVILMDSKSNLELLNQMRALGVQISLDDFGTGYSSLTYLRLFPFNNIKIDRSFVGDLGKNPGCLPIIRAISRLASDLGMETIAEGIETQEQLDQLRAEGCRQGQGYLFSRPVPADQTKYLIDSRSAAPVASAGARA